MRLAFVLYGGLGGLSGGFLYDRMLVEGLRGLGVKVDEVALPWPSSGRALLENGRPIPWPRPASAYDAVVQDELAHPALVVRNVALRAQGVPIVALVHNLTCMQPQARARPWTRLIEGAYLAGVDAAVAVCQSTRADILTVAGDSLPAHVAYAGGDHLATAVDDAFVESRARRAGPLRVLFVGAVSPHKGVLRLIEAVARVPEATLDIVGPLAPGGDHGARVRLAAAGLGGRVRIMGVHTGEALWGAYREAHVLALPSDREAYPIAAIEALASGLPVLVTDAGGAGELISDDREGRLLDPHDLSAWSAALSALARDRPRLARMGRAALARHRAMGSWAQTARSVAGFLASRRR